MFSLNRVQIIGYQTQAVNIRKTPSGTSVTDLNLVVPYTFQSEGGAPTEGKHFFVVTLWGPMAEVAGKFVCPGSHLFVGGRLQTDSWEDEKTGEKRSKTKVVAQEIIFLDPREGCTAPPEGSKLLLDCCNRADVIGNVTRDPEMRTTTSGQHVLTLGVATNERWKDKATGEDRERTEFNNVVVWGQLAQEVALHIKKGQRVYVTGRVQNRSWETREGGKRTTTEITAETVSLLGIKNKTAEATVDASAALAAKGEAPLSPAEPMVSPVEVPEIAYAPSVKAEDLPF